MSDNPFDAMAQAAADDDHGSVKSRQESNKRAQVRNRLIRRVLRIAIIVIGGGSFLLLRYGGMSGASGLISFFGFLLACIMAAVLFFMGGLAPARTRKYLSKSEQRLLDD